MTNYSNSTDSSSAKRPAGSPVNLTIWRADFRKQSLRRQAVLVTYVAALGTIAMLNAPTWHGKHWFTILAIPFFCFAAYGAWALNQVARLYAANGDCAPHQLADERQAAVRDRAFFHSYQAICSAVGLGLIWWMIAATAEQWNLWYPQNSGDFGAVLYLFLFVTITLPHALIAWREPDYDSED